MIKSKELTDPNSCMSRARDDEMTFVLLGRDVAAPVAIRAWCEERCRTGKNTWSDPQIKEAMLCYHLMIDQQIKEGKAIAENAFAPSKPHPNVHPLASH